MPTYTDKNYVGSAAGTTLSSGINSSVTSIAVADASTWPSTNFNVVIDRGLVGEEKVFCSSRSGNTLTVTRGEDDTTAAAHSSGAAIEHCGFAEDFQQANDHGTSSTDVHGLAGGAAVVGTTSTQTLTNKTLTAPVIADFTNAQHDHSDAAGGGVAAFHGVRVYRTSTLSALHNTLTVVPWTQESFDSDTFHDNVTNTSRLTVPAGLDGKYQVYGSILLPDGASGGAHLYFFKNGDSVQLFEETRRLVSGVNQHFHGCTTLDLVAGDYVEMVVTQTSGSTKNFGNSFEYGAHFGMNYVGA